MSQAIAFPTEDQNVLETINLQEFPELAELLNNTQNGNSTDSKPIIDEILVYDIAYDGDNQTNPLRAAREVQELKREKRALAFRWEFCCFMS